MRELGLTSFVQNSLDDLHSALQRGEITFSGGSFTGNFTANVSKELRKLGAVWDRKNHTYKLKLADLPMELRSTIALSEIKFKEKLKKIDKMLAGISPAAVASSIKITDLFSSAIFKVNSDLTKTLKKISVAPQLTPEQRERIAKEWSNNMELDIKGWTEKEIKKLRKEVQKTIYEGNRYTTLIDHIERSYGVSQRKAKFLARQETSLLMNTFKQTRYLSLGINEYKWKCVKGTPAHPVRPMHKELNDRSERGEIFNFNHPPVDDPNGSRHNPGMNYNCRCYAIPLIKYLPK